MATLLQKMTNPLTMLSSDHRYVKQTLETCLNTDNAAARRLLIQEIGDNLIIHAGLEEELFYPALSETGGEEGRRFVEEALRAHQEIKDRLNDVQRMDMTAPDFRRRLTALQERVLSHAEEEERIFPLAESRLPLGELAARMDMRRLQLMAEVRPPSGIAMLALALIGVGTLVFFAMRRQKV